MLESEVKTIWKRHSKQNWRNFDNFAIDEEFYVQNWIAISAKLRLEGCIIPVS